MKSKIGIIIFLAIFLVAGIVLAVVQDVNYGKVDSWLFSVISSFVITLSVAGIVFALKKHSFKAFLLVTALTNAAICIFHSFKQPYDTFSDGTAKAVMERFLYGLPMNLVIAVGVTVVCLIGYVLITGLQKKEA